MERFDELKDMMAEKSTAVVEDHPVAVTLLGGLVGLLAALPLCALAYKFAGSCAGKSAAKELIKAGVWTGYTHP